MPFLCFGMVYDDCDMFGAWTRITADVVFLWMNRLFHLGSMNDTKSCVTRELLTFFYLIATRSYDNVSYY